MKKYFILASAALALASCSSDDFIGNTPGSEPNSSSSAIRFDGGTGNTTRSILEGSEAATKLGNNFVVFGYKTTGDNSKSTVYDHYNVNWVDNAGSTQSNTKGWEYVGQTKNSLSESTGQTIKYWDYSASQYDFVAFSYGSANKDNSGSDLTAAKVTATKVNTNNLSYTLTGNVEDLAKCYIADRVTAKNINEDKVSHKLIGYQDAVSFNFRSLSSKVKIGIYETIPGYSVKDVNFYTGETNSDNNPTTEPTLYTEQEEIPLDGNKGTMTVTFGSVNSSDADFNEAKVTWKVADNNKNSKTISFTELSKVGINGTKTQTDNENIYLGQDITNASKCEYKTVLPNPVTNGLNLKVDYTLVSIDGSKEEIKVTGATALVPSQYTKWQPNYAYTYIFKISDKTNGSTGGTTDPKGLYPITFDAVVTETEEGKQETITNVEAPSITTYAKGAVSNEYTAGSTIYVSVENKELYKDNITTDSEGQSTTTRTDYAKLYKATTTGTQTITEANVAECLKSGKSTTDNSEAKTLTSSEGNVLTVTPVASSANDKLEYTTEISKDDSPYGTAISGNFAKFTAQEGTYVFQYNDGNNVAYKVIIVKNNND